MTSAATTSRLGVCQTCNTTPARYSCPACAFPSCSLACATAHKSARDCTGVAPPVWSRPIAANEMNWGSLMRDQSYIAGVGRAIEQVGKELVGERLIPHGRRLGADETVRLDERSDKEDKLVREARNQGVELMLLPKGMSKRQRNSTRWDPKKRQLDWMVEVAFQPRPLAAATTGQPPLVIATGPVPSNKSLKSALLDALGSRDKKDKGKTVDPEEATWRAAQREWIASFRDPRTEAVEGTSVPGECAQPREGPSSEGESREVEDDAESSAMTGDVPENKEDRDGAEAPRLDAMSTEGELAEKSFDRDEALSASVADGTSSRPPPHAAPTSPRTEDASAFVLLLGFHSRPIYPDSGTASHFAPSDAATAPSSTVGEQVPPRGRAVYLVAVDAGLTVRAALNGSTLLENPCFELWPRETFLRQKLLGHLRVVEQPVELKARARTGPVWERGRGRGGAGGGGGRGRGGSSNGPPQHHSHHRGGGASGRGRGSHHESSTRHGSNRSQDDGWGKRSSSEAHRGGDEKRVRASTSHE